MYIGIDIGGTKCAVISADENGRKLTRIAFPTTDYSSTMARMMAEIEKLRGMAFDCAFLPVDPRQGEDFYLGADSFIRMHQPKWVFPMHLWEDYDTIRRFREHDCAKGYRDTIVEIRKPGEDFEI